MTDETLARTCPESARAEHRLERPVTAKEES
jgi:hypothetical protein